MKDKHLKTEDTDEEFVETNEDGEELSGGNQLKKLREKLKEVVAEKQKYLENWQRDKAEFINARKRDEERNAEHLKYASSKFIEDILPVLDSFDSALHHSKGAENIGKEWLSGLESVYQQFRKVLAKYDVTSFGEVGDKFDPNLHHSIGAVPKEKEEDDHTLAEVLQKGYKMREKIIRAALVKIFE